MRCISSAATKPKMVLNVVRRDLIKINSIHFLLVSLTTNLALHFGKEPEVTIRLTHLHGSVFCPLKEMHQVPRAILLKKYHFLLP